MARGMAGEIDYAALAQGLKPFVLPWIVSRPAGGGAGGGGMSQHALNGGYHLGTLGNDQAPQFLLVDGTRPLAGNLGVAAGATIDGVDLSAHAADVNAHHAKLHGMLDAAHHQYTGGAALDVFGLSAASTMARLTPSADVSGGQTAILRSNAGALTLLDATVTDDLSVGDDASVGGSLGVVDELTVGSDLIRARPTMLGVGINVNPDGAAALDVRAGATSDHTQRIQQIAGQTGRLWRIENTSGQELIVLDSQGNLQSGNPGFVSGLTGWQITPAGNAEFNNGRFRGELRASVFAMEEIHASPGTLLVSRSAGTVREDVTLAATTTEALTNVRSTAFADQDYLDYRTDSATGSGTGITARSVENILRMDDPESGHAQIFNVGAILQFKGFTGSGVASAWLRVNSARDETTHYAYHVQVTDGTLPVTLRKGTAVVEHGRAGEGAIKASADGPYTPRLDVYTIGEQPWAGQIYPHLAAGRLDGVGVPGLSGILQWGVALGENLADASKPYMYATNLGVRQYKIWSEWHDGANTTARIESNGRMRLGTNVDSPAGTFLDANPVTGLATFRGAVEVLAGSSGYANLSDKPALGALAAQNDLDGVPNGATYARVNSTLISGGNLRVGSGTKDSTLNGWHIDAGEIVGQTAGVDQVVLGADGKIKAGAGNVILDTSGLFVGLDPYQSFLRLGPSQADIVSLFEYVVGGTGLQHEVLWRLKPDGTSKVVLTLSDSGYAGAPLFDMNVLGTGGAVRVNCDNFAWGTSAMIAARTTAW